MARTKISEFSATPANNTDIDSINIAENCPPSGINDAIRELMAQLKDFQTGAVGDSFNGPVGTTTAAAGAFTTLSASSTVSGTGFSTYLASPPAIGGTAAAAGSFTTLSASGNVTLSGGTANGVAYLNGSKALTSGSALTFDGTNLAVGASATSDAALVLLNKSSGSSNNAETNATLFLQAGSATTTANLIRFNGAVAQGLFYGRASNADAHIWGYTSSGEQMRLTSTGLGIGTSSPAYKLQVDGASTSGFVTPIVAKNPSTNAASGSKIAFDGGGTVWGEVGAAYNSNDPYMAFFVRAGSEKMRITDAGNLGLGVTPSAFTAGKAMEVAYAGNAMWGTGAGDFSMVANVKYNGALQYANTGVGANRFVATGGAYQWYTAPSGTAGNAITFTQAATLNANGDFGVGTTSPENYKQFGYGATIEASGGAGGSLIASSSSKTIIALLSCDTALGVATLKTNTNHPLAFFTNNTERARIDSSGNLLVGTTSNLGAKVSILDTSNSQQGIISKVDTYQAANFINNTAAFYVTDFASLASAGNNLILSFSTDATPATRGSVTYNRAGGVILYNTTSDYRAKDIYGAVTDSGSVIDSVPVYMGKMHGATQERPMFIAHETPSYAHTGEKDAVDADGNPVYQQMDASALIPVMWAEIQSLRKRLADAGIA